MFSNVYHSINFSLQQEVICYQSKNINRVHELFSEDKIRNKLLWSIFYTTLLLFYYED